MNEGGYVSKTLFLDKVDGNKIVEEQELINNSDYMKVVATTILPAQENGLFYAWIYYKVREDKLLEKKKEEVKETIKQIEETPQEVKDEIVNRAAPEIKISV